MSPPLLPFALGLAVLGQLGAEQDLVFRAFNQFLISRPSSAANWPEPIPK